MTCLNIIITLIFPLYLYIENFYQPSKKSVMKNTKQKFTMRRPKQIYQVPTLTFSFNNKQDLRDIITDYVLHHIEQQSKTVPSRKFKSKYVKYPNITLKVNINKEQREITFEFVTILSKYIEFEKKNIYRQDRIEPLIVDTLNFLDEMEEKTKDIIFEIDPACNSKKIQQEVLDLIIEKHHKDKQRKGQNTDLDLYDKKVIAKHTRISYIDIEDQLKRKQKQFLLEISDIGSLNAKYESRVPKNIIIPNTSTNISDRLKQLIDSGELFQNPVKIQELKKQKLMQFYQSNQVQYLSHRTEISDELQTMDSNTFTPDCAKMLKQWIADINVSQKYYQQKYARVEKKKAVNVDLDDQMFTSAVV